MKYRLLTLLGLIALGSSSMLSWSQDYDDVYYDSKKDNGTKAVLKPAATQVKSQPQRVVINSTQPYKVTIQRGSNIVNGRDVDEYNRRGNYSYENYDTTAYSSDSNQADFSNTERIERFYNPDIVINSNDDDLITLYYDNTPTVNLTIGSSWWGPSIGWGWSGWYGPHWSFSFCDPWYYTSWYSPYWYTGWYWNWYDPFFSWGWHDAFWGWGGHHGWDWGGPGPHHNDWAWGGGRGWSGRQEGGRRPMGFASNDNRNNGFARYNNGGNGISGRRPMGARDMNGATYSNNSGNQSTYINGHRGSGNFGNTGSISANNTGRMNSNNVAGRANVGNVGNMSRRPMIANGGQRQTNVSNASSSNRVYVPSTQRRSETTIDNSNRTSGWSTHSNSSSWGGSRSWGGSPSGGGSFGGGNHGGGFSGGGGHRR